MMMVAASSAMASSTTAALATGASLTGVTSKDAAVLICSVPSVTVTSKLTEPLKSLAGVKLQVPSSLSTSSPLSATTVTAKSVLSTSVTLASSWAFVMVMAAASSSMASSTTAALATGASLTGVTSRDAAVLICSVPSVTVTSKLTVPLKSLAGVKLQVPSSLSTNSPAVLSSSDTQLTHRSLLSTSVTLTSS